jgi:hypothetical protein
MSDGEPPGVGPFFKMFVGEELGWPIFYGSFEETL